MSDALQDAEALYELLGKSENYVTVKDVLKGAIDEIKRLQEENESQKTDYILMNKRYEAYIGGPGDDVKLLKGQLAAKDKEIEQLRSLIDLTAHNFLQLQPGITWEGGINDAMKAACEEIKRLREQISRLGRLAFFGKDDPAEKIIDHFIQWGDSTFKYLQESKEQLTAKDIRIQELKEFIKVQSEQFVAGNKQTAELLAKWREIAIEERANRLAATHVLTGMVPIRSIPATVATVEDHVAGFRERAAKELGLQMEQEASYLGRLETAFLEMYPLFKGTTDEQAQAALAKIREGKPL